MRLYQKLILAAIFLLWLPNAYAANNEAVAKSLSALFASNQATTGSIYADSRIAAIKSYYAKRNFKPIWVRDNGPKGKAKALVAEIRISAVHGLSPSYYNLKKINLLIGEKNPGKLARLELLLSGSFVEFGHDLRNGRIGSQTKGSMNALPVKPVEPDEYIRNAESAGNLRTYMGGLLQSDKRYIRLITKLTELLRIDASGQWPKIPRNSRPIKAKQSDKVMVLIRKILVLTGDLPIAAMTAGPVHDQITVDAVKKYQFRHGLSPTGNINMETMAAMSVPLGSRIEQIRTNLERRRWQVHNIGEEHVYVNLASKSLRVVSGGKTVAEHKLLAIDKLKNVPAFVGSINIGERVSSNDSENNLQVDSEFISKLSSAGSSQSIPIENYDDFVRNVSKLGKNSVPLFVTYVTAWATRDGLTHFRKDVFERDSNLATLLDGVH